jgi:hypothetical protein
MGGVGLRGDGRGGEIAMYYEYYTKMTNSNLFNVKQQNFF